MHNYRTKRESYIASRVLTNSCFEEDAANEQLKKKKHLYNAISRKAASVNGGLPQSYVYYPALG